VRQYATYADPSRPSPRRAAKSSKGGQPYRKSAAGPLGKYLQFSEDPSRDVVLLSVKSQKPADFYQKLKSSLGASAKHETFVFIHGYNVTFEDAARRVAQIKYDLAFDGPAILYSWPSYGQTRKYPDDLRNAEWAATDLKTFLTDLAARSGAYRVGH